MKEESKKKRILKILGLIGLFLIVFGLSYALFTVTLNGTKKVKIKSGKLELQLLDANNNPIYITDQNNTTSYEINLDEQVPVSDDVGLDSTAFEFKLKNSGNVKASYTIYLDDVALEEGEERLADEYVRYSLTKNGSEENPRGLSSRELDKGTIEADNTTNEYTLKIWIAEDATNEAMDKVFNATLRVEGTQYIPEKSPYGTKIAEMQLSETITATYYQPDDTGYNNTNKVKRMSNVQKIDNEEKYVGGTLVISGEGEIADEWETSYAIHQFLYGSNEMEFDSYGEADIDRDKYIYFPDSVIVEEGITRIGGYAFGEMDFSYISLPSSLREIGGSAFMYNESIQSIRVPEGVTFIETGAFWNCSNLETIYLPSTVETVETDSTFWDIANPSIIYVETQEVSNLLKSGYASSSHYNSSTTTVIVDPTKFE